ncbi:GIY-YIG nuclease family protein [Flavobacterium mekongense]|uniref:GIY-YIG nuclease family protein n=1 Tax=Flavobacterium mekongense TaxID=3379707 RepID=UPI00399A9979
MEEKYFKAFIRVVKSIAFKDTDEFMGFDTVEVLREPLIKAKDTAEARKIMGERYPQFFPTGKVYSKETKDDAQFFYVLVYPLYQFEINQIEEGPWKCDFCGHIHENKYISRPLISRKFEGKIFCSNDYKNRNDVINPDCYENFKKEYYKENNGLEIPDDLNFINVDSLNYIYKITEKSTGKCYIGKTRNAPFFRWWNHLKHSSSPFGLYFRNTMLSLWTFEVLEELPSNIPDSEVFKIETKYIQKFDSINNGFNSVISNKKGFSSSGNLFDTITEN